MYEKEIVCIELNSVCAEIKIMFLVESPGSWVILHSTFLTRREPIVHILYTEP